MAAISEPQVLDHVLHGVMDARSAAERGGIDECQDFRQYLDASIQGLFEKLFLRGNQFVLGQGGPQCALENVFGARLGQETKDASFVDRVNGSLYVRVASEHEPDRVGPAGAYRG